MNELSFFEKVSTGFLFDSLDKKLFILQKHSTEEVVFTRKATKSEGLDDKGQVGFALVSHKLIDFNLLPEDIRVDDLCWSPIGYYELMRSDFDFIEIEQQQIYRKSIRHIYSSLALSENNTVYEYVGFSDAYVHFFQRRIRKQLNAILNHISDSIVLFFFIEHCLKTERHRFVFVIDGETEKEIGVKLVQEILGPKFVVVHYDDFICNEKLEFFQSLIPHLQTILEEKRFFLSIINDQTNDAGIVDLSLAHLYNPVSGFDQNLLSEPKPLTEKEQKKKQNSENIQDFITLFVIFLLVSLFFFARYI